MQSKRLLCWATAGSCSPCCPADPKFPFQRATPQVSVLSHFLPRHRNLYVSSMNFIRFLLVHFSSLSRSLGECPCTWASWFVLHSFVSSTDLTKVHIDISSRTLIKTKVDSWDTPLVTKLQADNQPLTTVLWAQSCKEVLNVWLSTHQYCDWTR